MAKPPRGSVRASSLSRSKGGAYQGELLVERHLLHQGGLVVEEVGLHVAPHVREPPELVHRPEQEVVALVLLHGPCGVGVGGII